MNLFLFLSSRMHGYWDRGHFIISTALLQESGSGELSFNSPQTFRDIYRARPGRPQYAKDPKFYGSSLNAVRNSIVGNLDDANQARHR